NRGSLVSGGIRTSRCLSPLGFPLEITGCVHVNDRLGRHTEWTGVGDNSAFSLGRVAPLLRGQTRTRSKLFML
ncbi:hypothetical protein BaRGS_00001904, partial [Batillaria attramentaria]